MLLRPYQQATVDAVYNHLRRLRRDKQVVRSGTSSQATKGSDFIRRRSASYGGTSKQGVTVIQ